MNEKQYEVRITDFALEAIHGIASFIARELFNDAAAVRWLEKILDTASALSYFPERVPLTPEEPWRNIGVHRLVVEKQYLYFWIDEEQSCVHVIDVVYQRMDQIKRLSHTPLT